MEDRQLLEEMEKVDHELKAALDWLVEQPDEIKEYFTKLTAAVLYIKETRDHRKKSPVSSFLWGVLTGNIVFFLFMLLNNLR